MTPIVCLPVCHKDEARAVLWLRWAIWLAECQEFPLDREHMVIVPTHRVSREAVGLMADLCRRAHSFFNVIIERPADEDERGYPGSASHLFVRSLEICRKHHPGRPVLFLEPDTVPTRRSWFHEMADDYAARGKPIMGVLVQSTADATNRFGFLPWHVTGNAIYPGDALERYPSIYDCLRADLSMCPWKNEGYPWDLFCAHEFVPDAAETDLIHQIWLGDPWTHEQARRIKKNACLVHRSKDGSLIYAIAEKTEPDFLRVAPPPSRRFQLVGKHKLSLPGTELTFKKVWRDQGGRTYSVYCPTSHLEESILAGQVGQHGLSEISQVDYDTFVAQSARFSA